MLMGDEDTLALTNYTKTAQCISIKGTVYTISAQNYFNLVKASRQAQQMLDHREVVKQCQKVRQFSTIKTMLKEAAQE